jgi:hypothetical protein
MANVGLAADGAQVASNDGSRTHSVVAAAKYRLRHLYRLPSHVGVATFKAASF